LKTMYLDGTFLTRVYRRLDYFIEGVKRYNLYITRGESDPYF